MGIRVYDKDNDATIEVDAATAKEGFAKGRFEIRDRVNVRKGMQTGDVAPSDLGSALADGWDPVDEDEVRRLKVAREESDAVSGAIGLFEQAAAGASLGLSDVLATEVLGVDQERKAARAEGLGEVGDAAFLAGAVAPGLLTGGAGTGASLGARGAGLAARGARGLARNLLPPVRGLEAVGGLAERGVARALGGELGGLAGMGARGAIEGAGYEVGAQIHENVLGNRAWNAELLGAGLNGALLGGGIGVAIPGIARVARGKAKLPESAAAEVLARQVDGEPSDLLRRGAKMWAGGSASKADGIEKTVRYLFGTKEEANLLWRSQHDRAALMAERADEIVASTNKLNETVSRSVIETEGDFRRAAVARKMPKGADDVAPEMAWRKLGETGEIQALNEARLRAVAYGEAELGGQLTRASDRLRKLQDELPGMKAVDAHLAIQDTIRHLGEQQGKLRKVSHASLAAGEAIEAIKPVRDGLKKIMGDATIWGADLARMTTELSDTSAVALRARAEAGKGSVGRLLDPRIPTTPEDAMRFAKQATKYGGDATVEKVGAYFDAELAAMEAKARHFDDPVFKQRFDELTKAHKEWRATMKKNAEVADLIEAHAAMGGGAATTGILTALGPSGAAVTGGLLGGPLGAALGMAANVISRPQQALRTLSGIRHLLDQVDSGISESVGRMVTGMRPKAKSAGPARAAEKVARAFGGGVGRMTAIAGATYGDTKRRSARQEQAQHFQDRAQLLASSPDALVKELGPLMFDIDDAAPGLAGHLQANVQKAVMFLASKQPATYSDPYSGQPPVVDAVALAKYERYVEAIVDPIGTLDKLADGQVSIEHAEAMREVYPQIYQHAQGKILEELGAAAEEGRAIPYAKRVQVGIAFQIPTDRSLEPGYLARLAMGSNEIAKENAEQDRPVAAARAAKLETGARRLTATSRIESDVA